jgi:hypothetical protein
MALSKGCATPVEVGNDALKCYDVTGYRLCHKSRAVTFRGDNGSSFDRAKTLGCDNGSNELEAITFRSDYFFPLCCKALCDN